MKAVLSKIVALLALAVLPSFASAAVTATVTPGVWDAYLGAAFARLPNGDRLPEYTSEAACIAGVKANSTAIRSYNYTCRTRTSVVVVVTADPPPAPVNCEFTTSTVTSEWAPAVCPVSGTQTRTVTTTINVTRPAANGGTACPTNPVPVIESQPCTFVPPVEPPVEPPVTGVLFTDITSIPSCTAGSTLTVDDIKVTQFSKDASGNLVRTLVSAAASGLPTHAGRCLKASVTAGSGAVAFNKAFWASVQPGDLVYLRAGVYSGAWGEGDWFFGNGETYKKGTAAQPIAVVSYPSEVATLQGNSRATIILGRGDSSQTNGAAYLTFANLKVVGAEGCISGGGNTTAPSGGPDETGGKFVRFVGNDCSITNATANTMTGIIEFTNDGWKVLGNKVRDPSNRTVINNNHAVYLNGGGDDSEVAYNDFQVHTGHVIQVHQDGTPKLFERVSLHDNLIAGVGYGDMRGIGVINVADASTISVVGNVLRHTGQSGWGCFNFYRGQITVTDNSCTDSQGGLNLNGQYGGTRKVTADGNKVCPVSGYPRTAFEIGATASQLTETNIKACP